jgi:sec-independent protein translocase protein TatA
MSLLHWLVVALIVLLLFGRGRLPALMSDVAKGIKSFRAGMREDDTAEAAPPANPPVTSSAAAPANDPNAKTKV